MNICPTLFLPRSMNRVRLILPLILVYTSCSRGPVNTYTPVTSGRCQSDTLNEYHYAMPESTESRLPLLIILDSGGDGKTALTKILPALARIPCLAIGSDLVRNNFGGYIPAIDLIIEDAGTRFHADRKRVYLAGFSGGARMAFEYAKVRRVSGVLMCGAGPPVSSLKDLPCPVYLISGINDFNFSETYYNPLKIENPGNFVADYFRGRHEWPPAPVMEDGYLYLMAGSVPEGKNLIKDRSSRLATEADSLLEKGEYFFSLKASEKALSFNPGNKKAGKQIDEMRNNKELSSKINSIESDLQQESRIGQAYAQASLTRDSAWWVNEIRQLAKAIDNSSGDRKDHFLRIRAYQGILFYSILNKMMRTQPGSDRIPHLLAAYRMAEPENPDVYYHYSLFYENTGKKEQCIAFLKAAKAKGFNDQRKLREDFNEDILNAAGYIVLK